MKFSHIFHTIGEINTGNARFRAQFQRRRRSSPAASSYIQPWVSFVSWVLQSCVPLGSCVPQGLNFFTKLFCFLDFLQG